jgi:hypothetical protein
MSINQELIFKGLKRMAVLFKEEVTSQRMEMFVNALSNYDINKVKWAIATCAVKLTKFPSLADIINLIEPNSNIDYETEQITNAIFTAINEFGYNNATKASEYIGPVGWRVIQGFGKWESFALSVDYNNMESKRAQIRNSIRAILSNADKCNDLKYEWQKQDRKVLLEHKQGSKQINLIFKKLENNNV